MKRNPLLILVLMLFMPMGHALAGDLPAQPPSQGSGVSVTEHGQPAPNEKRSGDSAKKEDEDFLADKKDYLRKDSSSVEFSYGGSFRTRGGVQKGF